MRFCSVLRASPWERDRKASRRLSETGGLHGCRCRHAAAAEFKLSQALLPTRTVAPRHQPRAPRPLPRGAHHGTCLPEHLRTTAPGRTVSHKGGNRCWNRDATAHTTGAINTSTFQVQVALYDRLVCTPTEFK